MRSLIVSYRLLAIVFKLPLYDFPSSLSIIKSVMKVRLLNKGATATYEICLDNKVKGSVPPWLRLGYKDYVCADQRQKKLA